MDEGFRSADPLLVEILYRAAERIAAFHQHQVRNSFLVNEEDGILMGQKVLPLARVGLYVPGGTAAYPSSVLMNCIPAKLAGVKEICMVTPPGKNGKIPPNILAAARICGVDRVFRVGGAQAVAALAYGTESIPKVDKIVGPGNQFVAEAKKQVFGQVGIDMVAGPSEILVIADGKCRPEIVAADLLSQAEHDPNASAVLVTDSAALAEAVQAAVEEQLPKLLRKDIARASIDRNGKIIVAQSLDTAVEIANEIAPGIWNSAWSSPLTTWTRFRTRVCLLAQRPEALGDYFAGPNHTLPTSGTARFSSPLSVTIL
ncbi:MAG: histidinol dehydrogenase [Evtepia gabavorous]